MTVNVTRDRIKQGVRYSCDHCPIANAIREENGHESTVGYGRVTVYGGKRATQYRMPAEAVTFAQDFDAGVRVRPITFEMEEL